MMRVPINIAIPGILFETRFISKQDQGPIIAAIISILVSGFGSLQRRRRHGGIDRYHPILLFEADHVVDEERVVGDPRNLKLGQMRPRGVPNHRESEPKGESQEPWKLGAPITTRSKKPHGDERNAAKLSSNSSIAIAILSGLL
jgi:hypothetical protein